MILVSGNYYLISWGFKDQNSCAVHTSKIASILESFGLDVIAIRYGEEESSTVYWYDPYNWFTPSEVTYYGVYFYIKSHSRVNELDVVKRIKMNVDTYAYSFVFINEINEVRSQTPMEDVVTLIDSQAQEIGTATLTAIEDTTKKMLTTYPLLSTGIIGVLLLIGIALIAFISFKWR